MSSSSPPPQQFQGELEHRRVPRPFDHAWNSDDHGHFDVTLRDRSDFDQCVYQALVTITAEQVNAMTWMGMPPTIYEVFMAWQSGQLEAA